MSIAIITGGSRGLGKSMALHLADRGHDIILTYNSKQAEAESVVAEIYKQGRQAARVHLNVSDSKSFPAS
jgi:NAD(P)-dependent dehydrogenase (short-subunit alcohol dehydrogenase family)